MLVAATLLLAEKCDLPVVATTHPVHEPRGTSRRTRRACAFARRSWAIRAAPATSRRALLQVFGEMHELFADVPEAIENAIEIAKRCQFEGALSKPKLPNFPTPAACPSKPSFTTKPRLDWNAACWRSIRTKRSATKSARDIRSAWITVKTIVHMGFPRFRSWRTSSTGPRTTACRWARDGDPVLVHWWRIRWALPGSIPVQYDLIFERFLNPERVSMPDFDIDFCQEGRDRVIDYVKKKVRR